MGKPMVGYFLDASHEVFAYVRKDLPADLFAKGAIGYASVKNIAAACETLFLMVPDTPDVSEVLFGHNGATEGLSAGKIVVECRHPEGRQGLELAGLLE